MNVAIFRHAYLSDVTLGNLWVGSIKLATLEEPWIPDPHGPGGQRREGTLRESCVPDGDYKLRPHVSDRYQDGVWALVNPALGVYYQPGDIPAGQRFGRSAILIHAGNTVADIQGCVLVGRRHGRIEGTPAVLDSRVALAELRELLGLDYHSITIRPMGTKEAA